jgi:ATP-binding cassette, subfamily B, bacterial
VIGPLDCGPAALSALAAEHGIAITVRELCDRLPHHARGSSLLELTGCARGLGLDAFAVEATPADFDALPLPLVAHVDGSHWVLVRATTEDAVLIEDPSKGPLAVRRAVFDRRWSGFALVVHCD